MQYEFIRWKKYEQLQDPMQQGWKTEKEIEFNTSFEEIVSSGILVKEDKSWLTIAYSLWQDKYLNPLNIFKENIIERVSHIVGEQIPEVKPEITPQVKPNYCILNGKQFDINLIPTEYATQSYKIDLEKFVSLYEELSQKHLASTFGIPIGYVSKIINILVENKIVKAHRRQWNSKLRKQGRVGNGRPNNSLNLPEEKAKLIFDYYKQNITYVKIAELLDLTYLQVNNFIESNIKLGIIQRRPRLNRVSSRQPKQQVEQPKVETKPEVKEEIKIEIKEPIKEDVKEVKPVITLPKHAKGLIEDEVYLYSLPQMKGVLKFNPPINKEEFIHDMQIMEEEDLCKKYQRPIFLIKAVCHHLEKAKEQQFITFIHDAETGYKWVFKNPILISAYLQDKQSLTVSKLKQKYQLSSRQYKMVELFLDKKKALPRGKV